jgi:hypothetical protein
MGKSRNARGQGVEAVAEHMIVTGKPASVGAGRLPRWERWLVIAIAVLCLVVYLGNGVYGFPSGDAVASSEVPFALLYHGNFYVGKYVVTGNAAPPYYVVRYLGHYINRYPIGVSITSLPLYFVYWLFGGVDTVGAAAALGKISAALMAALSVAILYVTIRRAVGGTAVAAFVALLYGLGSEVMSISSQGMWQQSAFVLWAALFLFALTIPGSPEWRGRPSGSELAAGLSLGMMFLVRPIDLVMFLPVCICCLCLRSRRRMILMAFAIAIPLVVGGIAYNEIFSGHLFDTGYGGVGQVAGFFSFPLLPGLLGNLFSPSKGLVVFMPWVLVALAAPWSTGRSLKCRLLCASLILGLLLYLLLYSKYYQWPAGYCYGPRYMVDVLPILSLLSAVPLEYVWKRRLSLRRNMWLMWTLAVVIVAWSCGLQLLGTYVQAGSAWNDGARPNTFLHPLWSAVDSEPAYYLGTLLAMAHPPAELVDPRVRISDLRPLVKPLLWESGHVPRMYFPGTVYHGTAVIHNLTDQTLPVYAAGDVVHFSYTVWKDGDEIVANGIRTVILHPVAPNASERVYFEFATPASPGMYSYVFTLVQENVQWFQPYVSHTNAYILNLRVV